MRNHTIQTVEDSVEQYGDNFHLPFLKNASR